MIQKDLLSATVDGQNYYLKSNAVATTKSQEVSLLSWFDEYIIGYKDRSAAFDPSTEEFIVKPKNGIYTPVILINGKIAGNWKRSIDKNDVKIDIAPFRKFNDKEKKSIDRAIRDYRSFLKS
jgi:hypothetical protein